MLYMYVISLPHFAAANTWFCVHLDHFHVRFRRIRAIVRVEKKTGGNKTREKMVLFASFLMQFNLFSHRMQKFWLLSVTYKLHCARVLLVLYFSLSWLLVFFRLSPPLTFFHIGELQTSFSVCKNSMHAIERDI